MLSSTRQDDQPRLQALKDLQILDASQDEILNKITVLTCKLLDMPTCLVTLITDEKQCIKAKTNFPLDETARDDAFCQHTLHHQGVLVCPDTWLDARFRDLPLARQAEQPLRFYAGAPLTTDQGVAIGSLCVIDYQPRTFSEAQCRTLQEMAAVVMALLQSRSAVGLVDAVTGLPNRQRLIADLHEAQCGPRDCVLFLIDGIDITYAYEMGRSLGMPMVERVLCELGDALHRAFCGREKIYCIATGRFALWVPQARSEAALQTLMQCAESLPGGLSLPVPIRLEMHIGYTGFSVPVEAPQQVLRKALSALHDAAEQDVVLLPYRQESDEAQRRAFRLLSDLVECLDRDTGLYLMYQPKFDLLSGEAVGAEALLRWQHPMFGAVSPGQFVPLAENTTLIRPLTQWVIAQATRQLRQWRNQGIMLPVAINVAVSNFAEPDFVERLMVQLDAHGLTPADLEIECLETQKLLGSPAAMACLRRLREAGFVLALDDFGNGHSNLTYLKRIPVEVIKLDQSLIRPLHYDADCRIIVEQVIGMLHRLNYVVVAEGVEDAATLDWLRRARCDRVQGFHLARPMLPEALSALMLPEAV
ncbi:sensor domain-containing phosphodiesterase [Chimaeribacter coloradensis]|uniref:Sensor domain-containing phosphodiesterase n=1 Tax=Chimaeribacter coloradensis TaxID=2060068 RepID=A0A2N5E4Z0_9GAMM|nr:sensor domain-containing phosphodiesterase [Chimaeribacter coloradensis]PLR36051.1 sensor domain-containing phosphodiesterase [Chimaeribacter coloradensis]